MCPMASSCGSASGFSKSTRSGTAASPNPRPTGTPCGRDGDWLALISTLNVLGGFTRLFSLAGIFFLVNTMLATFGHDWLWSYLMPIGILGVVFLSGAGRAWGIDRLLAKRFGERGWLLW